MAGRSDVFKLCLDNIITHRVYFEWFDFNINDLRQGWDNSASVEKIVIKLKFNFRILYFSDCIEVW